MIFRLVPPVRPSLRRGALAVAAATALLALPGAAQDGGKVELQFVSFPRVADAETVELVIGEGRTLEVEIPSHEVSDAYKVPRLGKWAVGESALGEDGEKVFHVFGEARALGSPSQLILLIRKGKDNAAGFDVFPLDNRVAGFGGGKFLFVNAAKVAIAGEIGAEKFVVRPGAHALVAPKPLPGLNACQTALFYDKDGEARPFFNSRWPLNPAARGLIFFYHDPKSGRLRFHSIRDFL